MPAFRVYMAVPTFYFVEVEAESAEAAEQIAKEKVLDDGLEEFDIDTNMHCFATPELRQDLTQEIGE